MTLEQIACISLGFDMCSLSLLVKAQSISSVLFISFFESSCLRPAHSKVMIIIDCKRMMTL